MTPAPSYLLWPWLLVLVPFLLTTGTTLALWRRDPSATPPRAGMVLAGAALLLSFLPLCGGGAGYALAMARGFQDVANVDPSEKAALLAANISLAMQLPVAGLVGFGLAFCAALAVAVRMLIGSARAPAAP